VLFQVKKLAEKIGKNWQVKKLTSSLARFELFKTGEETL